MLSVAYPVSNVVGEQRATPGGTEGDGVVVVAEGVLARDVVFVGGRGESDRVPCHLIELLEASSQLPKQWLHYPILVIKEQVVQLLPSDIFITIGVEQCNQLVQLCFSNRAVGFGEKVQFL